jgi:hypothetical protein
MEGVAVFVDNRREGKVEKGKKEVGGEYPYRLLP